MAELEGISGEVARVTRDAAYVVIGLGVLGFQRTQVQRQALQRRLNAAELDEVMTGVRFNLVSGIGQVNELVEQTIANLESSVEPLEQQLPPTVRSVVDCAQARARQMRGQIRQAVESAI